MIIHYNTVMLTTRLLVLFERRNKSTSSVIDQVLVNKLKIFVIYTGIMDWYAVLAVHLKHTSLLTAEFKKKNDKGDK